ncbi:hypothetical protein [Prevotella heparinolytica]|nr:hypothetical protein [Bacteroides heparinolyticus]
MGTAVTLNVPMLVSVVTARVVLPSEERKPMAPVLSTLVVSS